MKTIMWPINYVRLSGFCFFSLQSHTITTYMRIPRYLMTEHFTGKSSNRPPTHIVPQRCSPIVWSFGSSQQGNQQACLSPVKFIYSSWCKILKINIPTPPFPPHTPQWRQEKGRSLFVWLLQTHKRVHIHGQIGRNVRDENLIALINSFP